MTTTKDNLCDSCTNFGCEFQSGIVRTKCAFYMPSRIEADNCGNYIVMQTTVCTIPKEDQYKARLKADISAMLDKIRAEIEEIKPNNPNFKGYFEQNVALNKVFQIIDKYKAENEDKNA